MLCFRQYSFSKRARKVISLPHAPSLPLSTSMNAEWFGSREAPVLSAFLVF